MTKDSRESGVGGWEFAPDDGTSVEPDPAFEAWIAGNAKAINTPGDTPRDAMWRNIQGAMAATRDAQSGQIPGVTPLRRAPWKALSLIAAALLVGVALDRMVLQKAERVEPTVASAPAAPDSGGVRRLYRLAASQTLTQAEALLVAYRSTADASRDPLETRQLGEWGRQVLSSTRLLIDSPAGRDPQLRALLEDLELVLVQIIRLSGPRPDPIDREHVDRALEDRALIPRIRTAVPAGYPAAASE